MNLLSILKTGNARNESTRADLTNGIRAARPAPTQCILPVATRTMDPPSTSQNALLHRNARRASEGRDFCFDHHSQIKKAAAISSKILGIFVSVIMSCTWLRISQFTDTGNHFDAEYINVCSLAPHGVYQPSTVNLLQLCPNQRRRQLRKHHRLNHLDYSIAFDCQH